MYLLLGFLRFSVIFFAMARYLQSTVNLGTVFPKNVLEAFGPQKSSFTVGKLTFLWPEGLQSIFWKNCPYVNCESQISSHCKKLERKISKTLGEDTFSVFYFRNFNVIFFSWNKNGHLFLSKKCDHSILLWAFM